MQTNRRDFLKTSFATAAACGLARLTAANDAAPSETFVDTHVYLDHWPYQRLPGDDPADLVTMLRRNQVGHAWVGSFDGLFYKDIGGVNQRLAEACARSADELLLPFGTINPTLPDWDEDVRRCHETFHMPGIRLHPNYHGYTLDDPRFARLLELATSRGLIVQLVAWMDDERHLFLNPPAAQVDLKALAEKIAPFLELRLVVANEYRGANDEAIRTLLPKKQIYFDFARAANATEVRQLVDKASPDHVVFGSCAPLHSIEEVSFKMKETKLAVDDRRAIANGNASRLIALTRKTPAKEPNNAPHGPVNTQ